MGSTSVRRIRRRFRRRRRATARRPLTALAPILLRSPVMGARAFPAVGRRPGRVDLEINGFRLELGRVEGDQIFRLDTVRETIRLGAGIDERGMLTAPARARRAGLPRALRRAAARTAPVRRARCGDQHLPGGPQCRAVPAAGRRRRWAFRSTSSAGLEEARLIYIGVAHVTAALAFAAAGHRHRWRLDRVHHRPRPRPGTAGVAEHRLRGHDAPVLRRRRAVGNRVRRRRNPCARRDRGDRPRVRARPLARGPSPRRALRSRWPRSSNRTEACRKRASRGAGLARLRKRMIGAGHVRRLKLAGLKPERTPVLAGGSRSWAAALAEL